MAQPSAATRSREEAKGDSSTGSSEPGRLRLEYLDPATLDDNPANWRTHPAGQVKSLRTMLSEVGWAGALLFNERTGRLVDGHARKAVASGEPVPVLVGSWSEEQEKKIMASLDPIGAMAGADPEKLGELLASVQGLEDGVEQALRALVEEPSDQQARPPGSTRLTNIGRLPRMAWVLIGIPLARFGEIAELVQKIAALPEVVCDIAKSDEPRK